LLLEPSLLLNPILGAGFFRYFVATVRDAYDVSVRKL